MNTTENNSPAGGGRRLVRTFPKAEVCVVHQTGAQLTEATIGAEFLLHYRAGEEDPCCAELLSGDHHAEIGLWFTGRELADYDGVFSLPSDLALWLRELGYTVSEDMV